MTKPTIALTELVEKGADADLLKQMIQFVAQRMMEFDVEGLPLLHRQSCETTSSDDMT